MNKTILTIAAGTTIALSSAAFAAQTPATKLIQNITKNEVRVIKSVPVTKNLSAYILQAKKGGQYQLVYVNKQGNYLFAGNLVNKKGDNVTAKLQDQYIQPLMAKKLYKGINNLKVVTQGNNNAAHKAYVFVDPNCIYCHMLYKNLQPMIKANKLQVKWIPIAFLKPSSLGKASAILAAGSNQASVELLNKDESNFNSAKESGGIKPLSTKTPTGKKAAYQVQNNTKYFFDNGYSGTPVIAFVAKDGKKTVYQGYLPPKVWNKVAPTISNRWQ